MRFFVLLLAFLSIACNRAETGPYDPNVDARAALQAAQAVAKAAGQPVFVVFGANWCEDCRAFDRAMKVEPSASLIARSFQVVKVDVGNFDRNLDIAEAYGNPTKKGIPAAVLLSPDGRVLYATRAGELANARRMGDAGIHDFLVGIAGQGAAKGEKGVGRD